MGIQEVRSAFTDYAAAVDAFVATVEEKIAAAVKADDDGEAVDLDALAAEITAAKAKLPVVPEISTL